MIHDITKTLVSQKNVILFPPQFSSEQAKSYQSASLSKLLIPVNFSMTINNVGNVDIENMSASVNTVITLAVHYGWLNDVEEYKAVLELLRHKMIIEIFNDESIMLTKDNKFVDVVEKRNEKVLIFTVRKSIDALLAEKVFFTPIQKLHILFSIKIRSIYEPQILQFLQQTSSNLEENNYNFDILKHLIIKFNLMSFIKNKQLHEMNFAPQLFFGDELNIGEYEIDTKQSITELSMYSFPENIIKELKLHYLYSMVQGKRKKKAGKHDAEAEELQSLRVKKNRLKTNNYAHISITLFRHPTVTFITVILPLIFISFVNLASFGIPTGKDGENIKRLLVLVTSIVSYIGLISALRAKIPPTDKPTFIQFLVFAQLIPSLAALSEAIRYRQEAAPKYSTEFIIGIVVTAIILIFCFGAMFLYYFVYFSQFRKNFRMVNPAEEEYICDRKLWENRGYRSVLAYMQFYDQPAENLMRKHHRIRGMASEK